MFKFLTKDLEFKWDDHCQSSFKTLELNLPTTHVLREPNWSIPFHFSSNASNMALGVVLGKKYN